MNSVAKISLLLCALGTGCATHKETTAEKVEAKVNPVVQPEVRVIDTSCDWIKIITVSNKDILTPETAQQILTDDKTKQKHCPKASTY